MKDNIIVTLNCLALLLVSIFTSCTDDDSTEMGMAGDIPTVSSIDLSVPELSALNSVNDFSLDVFQAALHDTPQGNVAVSPFSLTVALAMAANTSGNAFSDEVVEAMGRIDAEQLGELAHKLLRFVPDRSNGSKLTMANSIWFNTFDGRYRLSGDYSRKMQHLFYSNVSQMDFESTDMAKTVNSWIYDKTSGIIPEMVSDVDDDVMIMLINAMHFQCEWDTKFDRSLTTSEIFHGANGATQAAMMHGCFTGRYMENEDFELLSKSLKGKASMVFVLPKDGNINDLPAKIKYEHLICNRQNSDIVTAILSLPKWTVDSSMDFAQLLPSLGITTVKLDLRVIGGDVGSELKITHKVCMSIDEDGAVVGSATIVEDNLQTALHERKKFTLDRPFLYYILNDITGSVIVAGRISQL